MTIQESLVAVMEDVRAVAKGDRNTAQNFNFRGIDAVVNAVSPALRKHGVVVVPLVEDFTFGTIEVGAKRTPMGHVIVKVRYRFIGAEGDSIDAVVIGEAMDSGDKAMPKAMSVAFRTALLQALALPTDEVDPDATSYQRSEPKQQASKETVTSLLEQFKEAPSVDALTTLASDARNTYDLTSDQQSTLRTAFLVAKTQLEETTK